VSPTHANFIVNDAGASAADIRTLIERCKREVWAQHGVRLREEIVSIGFEHPAAREGAED
jgi:UDP-N-acetylenolpyruvoylglucosamine reductase